MRYFSVSACLALSWVATCVRTEAVPPGESPPNARSFATFAGRVIGAASACQDVEAGRIYAVSGRIAAVLRSAAASEDEASAMNDLLIARESEGQRLIAGGQLKCPDAGRDFANLENTTALAAQTGVLAAAQGG